MSTMWEAFSSLKPANKSFLQSSASPNNFWSASWYNNKKKNILLDILKKNSVNNNNPRYKSATPDWWSVSKSLDWSIAKPVTNNSFAKPITNDAGYNKTYLSQYKNHTSKWNGLKQSINQ